MRYSTLLLSTLLLFGFAGIAAAQDELPKADEVFTKFIEASGGKAAYDKITNRVTKMFMEQMGMKINITIYQAKPGKNYTVVEMGGMGKQEKGTNGKVAWEMSPMTGTKLFKDREREDFVRDSTFDKWVNWKKLYSKAECVGTSDVNGKTCYKLLATMKYENKKEEGETAEKPKTQTLYFEKDSHLLVRIDMPMEGPMGSATMEYYLEDYKKVDGILHPHKSRMKVMGQEMVTKVTSIEQNVELPENRFDPPEEIKALLEKEKAVKEK